MHGFINIFLGLFALTMHISIRRSYSLGEGILEEKRIDIKYVIIAFSTGAITIAMEILMFRILGISQSMSSYVFPIVLFFFLIGIAAGSIVFKSSSITEIKQLEKRMKILILFSLLHLPLIFIIRT